MHTNSNQGIYYITIIINLLNKNKVEKKIKELSY